MYCTCGAKTKIKKVALYHYRECGLPNVYLAGIDVASCKECSERFPVIPSILGLYEKIAEAVALKPQTLVGIEVKFLRKQLGLTAVQWASYLKTDKATVSRWENDHNPIGRQSDALVRYLYFRLLEEKDNKHIYENISNRITSAENRSDEELGFKIPADNPGAYSFQSANTLSRAAAC
jgi:transcriptional regulator with XRE-family HTH domain